MASSSKLALAAAALALAVAPPRADAWNRGRVRTFAVLPAGATGPEGLEVDARGNVYVATFGFNASGAVDGTGQIHVYDDDGRFLRTLSLEDSNHKGSTSHLLGLRFHPSDGRLLVADFGASQVLSVDPLTGVFTVFLTLPVDKRAGASLNDITFDLAGNVYVSDSFQGVIWTTGSGGGEAQPWVDSPLLRTTGTPPFGANGLRFNKAGSTLFVANTGDDTVVEIPATWGPGASAPKAGTASVFVNSVNGADGLLLDAHDNLWVAANQADEIVVIDPTGRAIAKLGDFGGAVEDGVPVGLLFPASPRFLGQDDLLVTNLALDIRLFGLPESVDSRWCAEVGHYTVSRIHLREGGDDSR